MLNRTMVLDWDNNNIQFKKKPTTNSNLKCIAVNGNVELHSPTCGEGFTSSWCVGGGGGQRWLNWWCSRALNRPPE